MCSSGDLMRTMRTKKGATYIAKPEASAQGKGIFLFRNVEDIPQQRMVVQEYIAQPLLIDGFKFDMRIYAMVISCDPLCIYLYKEGLARFCTTPYARPNDNNIVCV